MTFSQFVMRESKQSFFDDLPNWGVTMFDNPMYFKQYQDADIILELKPQNDGVRLSHIQAKPMNTGAGSRFMQELVDKADEHNVPIFGLVDSEGGGPSQRKLKRLYEKFGFEIDDDDNMVRWPNGGSAPTQDASTAGPSGNPVIKLRSPRRVH